MRDPYLYDDANVLKNFANIKSAERLRKAEADITGISMAAVYNMKYDKFNTETLCDIHKNIFGQIYDWAGEFRTIQMVKYEDVLGGDTVRYAYPKEIKKQLNETMNIHFHGLNFYSKQPQIIFDFYKALGFRVVQEKESDDYYGAALALTDEKEPVMWIWSIPEGKEQPCCNNLYFTADGKVDEIYENIKVAGIDCPEPIKTFWGGTELTVTDPDGNTILFL